MPEEQPWGQDDVVELAPGEQPEPVGAPVGDEPAREEPEAPEPTGPSRQPELGSTVNFVLPVGPNQGQDRLAIVSWVFPEDEDRQNGLVDCHIFGLPQDHPNVTSTHLVRFAQRVPYSQQRQPGTWHWPGEAGEKGDG
jgi:hypothetical protein